MILTLKKRNTFTHKQFVVSLITVGFVTSMLVVGSAGSLLQQASARSNNRYNNDYSSQGRTDRSGSNSRTSNQNKNEAPKTTQTQQKQAPATKKQATPPAAPAQSASTPTPPATPQITRTPAIVQPAPPAPVDTAAESSNMTTTQAATSAKGQSVAYTPSQRITEDTRNRLLILAGAATVIGGLLYTLSYVGAFSPSGRAVPIRYIVPVKEVATS